MSTLLRKAVFACLGLVFSLSVVSGAMAQSDPTIPLTMPSTGHKSSMVAVLLSLVVPGLGEAYAGRFDAGRYFTASEVVLVGGYIGLSGYTSNFQNDMESYAIDYAGVSTSHHGDYNYFTNVGAFQNSDLFNGAMLRNGTPGQMVSAANGWRWATTAQEQTFNSLRIRVQTLDDDRSLVIGAIVINHLLSAIDAYVVTRKVNQAADSTHSGLWQFGAHMGALYDPRGASVTAALTF